MSVILRHKRFPFIMIYSDPKESWGSCAEKMLLEEISDSKFDNFVEESSVPLLFQKLFNPVADKDIDTDQKEEGSEE